MPCGKIRRHFAEHAVLSIGEGELEIDDSVESGFCTGGGLPDAALCVDACHQPGHGTGRPDVSR
jgi:hypothetical protein